MTPGDAMLKDILAYPKDDVVRLVYADWLDEVEGQTARAEFIRTQIALAPMRMNCCCFSCVWSRGSGACRGGPCEANQPPYDHLYEREQELFREHATRWFGTELSLSLESGTRYLSLLLSSAAWDWPGESEINLSVERGFVHRVETLQDSWLQHGTSLAASQPIQEVWFQDRKPWRSGDVFFVWSGNREDEQMFISSCILAWEIFCLLPPSDDPECMHWGSFRRWYKGEGRAWEALAEACVKWARLTQEAKSR